MAESRDTNGQKVPENVATGRLNEHQQASDSSRKTGTKLSKEKAEQTEAQKRVVRMCEGWLTDAKRDRARYDTNWVSQVRYIEGKQWTERRPSYRHSEIINLTWSAVQTIIPILTDNRPNIETLPEEPTDFEFSEIITHILRSKWDRQNFSQVVAEGIVDMAGYGTCVSKQEWDPDDNFGLGEYEFETVDPLYCYPDPNARNVNDKYSKRFQTAVPTDIEEVKRRYPKWAHLIKPNISETPLAKQIRTEQEEDYRVRAVSDYNILLQSSKPMDPKASDQVLLITTYCKSEEVEEFEISEKDQDGNEKKKFQTRKKYPNGRKIVHANGILLEDGDNPYIDGKFPFARCQDHLRARTFWGIGEVEQLRGPQDMLNKLVSYMMDVLILMGNPIWVVDASAGVDTDNLVNQPGAVIEKNPNSEVRRESGVNLQPYILQAIDQLIGIFDKISGINDVSQGAQPRNASGVAIELLQEASQTKLRHKSRNIEAWLTEVGQQHVARILQYYEVPRIIRLTGDDNAGRFFKVAIDETIDEAGEAQKSLQVQEFAQDELTGEIQEGEVREMPLKGNLDVKVTTGTALPFAKANREARANRLLEIGIYDEEDYLEDIQHPRKDKILRKVSQRKEAEADAAAAEFQGQQNANLELENVRQLGQVPPIGG